MKYRVARFRVAPPSLDAARQAIQTFVEGIAEHEPGTLRYDAFADKDGTSFTHVMAFENSEAEDQHRNASHVSQFVSELYPLCEEQPVFTELVPVATLGAQNVRARNVHHRVRLPASPDRIYHALLDPAEHAEFTGYPVQIDPTAGGRFVTCGDRNLGWTLELVPNRRIVQAWRHKDWPEGTWSTVTFALSPAGAATDLDFTQTGVPSEAYAWIEPGWKTTYWTALDRWLRR